MSTQLTPYRQSPEEYGLSLNADVALWLDSRAYNNQPPLRQFCDFVFITSDLHAEFDSFREKENTCSDSIFPLNSLLEYWNRKRPAPLPTITMYGKSYLKLNASETDELCQWVYDTREKGLKLGDDEMGPNYLINTGGYCMTTPAAHVGVALCNIRRPRDLINILGTSGFPIHPLEAGF